MNPVEPILVADRFHELNAELLSVLWGLEPEAWGKPTACPPWTVKDLTAHLLDIQVRRLSAQRDGVHPGADGQPAQNYDAVVEHINAINASWVQAARRISPPLLVEFIAIVGDELGQFFAALDPLAPAAVSVLWAGQTESPQWLDTAREFSELWTHQQHIRDALGQPLITSHRLAQPALDTFLRGLPHAFRHVSAPEGASLWVCITGEAGDDWTLLRQDQAWQLYSGHHANPTARIQLEQDLAWRVFTKGLSPAEALPRVSIQGEAALAAKVLNLVSIMA